MRFLCLHGAGTNSKIFEAQTAALRYELGGNHTYEFVEGHIPQPQAPAIERFATSGDEYYAYYIPGSQPSFTTAKAHLQVYVETEGPFDGVIAFSQGASLASALLLGDEHAQALPFRCAILICGRLPMTDERSLCNVMGAGKEGLQKEDEEKVENDDDSGGWDCKERQIRVPTVHIMAANDPIDPGHAKALWTCCNAAVRWEYVHELGHEVPGARDQEVLVESVNAIRRMLGAVGSTC